MDRTHCPQCIYHPRTVQIEEFYLKTLKPRVASEESSRIWDDVTNTNILRVYDSDNVPSFGYRIDRMPVSGSIRINIYNFITFLYEWFGKKKKIPIQKCEKIEIKRLRLSSTYHWRRTSAYSTKSSVVFVHRQLRLIIRGHRVRSARKRKRNYLKYECTKGVQNSRVSEQTNFPFS